MSSAAHPITMWPLVAPSSSETLYTNWGYAGWGPNINSYRGSLGTTTCS